MVNAFVNKVAKIITSKFNQNYTLIFTGPTGSGKSYASISFAMALASRIAEIKGGRPSDFFEVDRCMSVIDIWKFFDVLENAQPYNVVVCDDAGVGLNARKFMDAINVTVNNISQTYRTLNLCTIFSVPEMYFVDRVIRSLCDALCEMEGMITADLSRGKIFEIQRKSRLGSSGKLFYTYPRSHQEKTIGITFERPPEHVCVKYETLRKTAAEEYRIKSIELLREGEAKLAEKKEGLSPKKNSVEEAEILIKHGIPVGESCAKAGISTSCLYKYRDKQKGQ